LNVVEIGRSVDGVDLAHEVTIWPIDHPWRVGPERTLGDRSVTQRFDIDRRDGWLVPPHRRAIPAEDGRAVAERDRESRRAARPQASEA
jgi:hypothetical protein